MTDAKYLHDLHLEDPGLLCLQDGRRYQQVEVLARLSRPDHLPQPANKQERQPHLLDGKSSKFILLMQPINQEPK